MSRASRRTVRAVPTALLVGRSTIGTCSIFVPSCFRAQPESWQRDRSLRPAGAGRSGLRFRWLLACCCLRAGTRLGSIRAGICPRPRPSGSKGTPTLQVFARRHALGAAVTEVTKVKDGDRLAAGDALRFVLSPTGLPYVLIASVDGAAQTSVYYPFQGEASVEVDSRGPVPVPGSIVLDQAPGPERIFVIHSERPISASMARAALARLGAGGADAIRAAQWLPIEGTVQSTLCFEKESGR